MLRGAASLTVDSNSRASCGVSWLSALVWSG